MLREWKAWPRPESFRGYVAASTSLGMTDSLWLSYEHTRFYRNHLDRQRISIFWAGQKLPRYPRPKRERHVFDAFPCTVDRLGAAGRKRHPGFVLVLEHRWKRDDVPLLHLQTRSGRHPRLSSQFDDLHSQFDVDSKGRLPSDCCRAFTASPRDGLRELFLGLFRILRFGPRTFPRR